MSDVTPKDALLQASKFLTSSLSEVPIEEFFRVLDIPPEFVRVRAVVMEAIEKLVADDSSAGVTDLLEFLADEDSYDHLDRMGRFSTRDMFSVITSRIEAVFPMCKAKPKPSALDRAEEQFTRHLFAADQAHLSRYPDRICCYDAEERNNNYVEMLLVGQDDLGECPCSFANASDRLRSSLLAHVRHGRAWNNQLLLVTEDRELACDAVSVIQDFAKSVTPNVVNSCYFTATVLVCEEELDTKPIFLDMFAFLNHGNQLFTHPTVLPYPDEIYNDLVEEERLPADIAETILPAYIQLARTDESGWLERVSLTRRGLLARLVKEYMRRGEESPYLTASGFSSSIMEAITNCPKRKVQHNTELLARWMSGNASEFDDPAWFAEMLCKDVPSGDDSVAEQLVRVIQDMRRYVNDNSVDLRYLPYNTKDELQEAGITDYKLGVLASQCEALGEAVEKIREAIDETRRNNAR